MSRTRSPRSIIPFRFYVMNTEVPRILISHAASFWLGLVKVLCDNKAPRIKRQVASIDKKSDFRAKDGPKMTSTQRLGSSSQKRESRQRRSLQEKPPFQVQGCRILRMPKYKANRMAKG